ncbi:hypothetical protein EDD22DRAFT_957268 [Suillus occidentalis]|nr:hypothetical protein EDD22DRAFT_957268 [Suillus occidentalis]
MPSTLTSPGSKAATGRAKRFNPYDRPSPHVGASSDENSERLTAPLMRRFAMCFNEYDVRLGQETLNSQLVWMGSAMSIDEPKSPGRTLGSAQDVSNQSPDVACNEVLISIDQPKSPGGTLGSAQDVSVQSPDVAGNEVSREKSRRQAHELTMFKAYQVPIPRANIANAISDSQAVGHLSLKKKLVRSLQKSINKYLSRHCKREHRTTDLLCERICAALEGVLTGMEVNDIMLKHYSRGADNHRTNDNILRTGDNFIPPVAQHIWNSMKRGVFLLETTPSARLICRQGAFMDLDAAVWRSDAPALGSLAGMPGGYPI